MWVPRKPQDPRDPRQIPKNERYYFLEERYPDVRQSRTARHCDARDLRRLRPRGTERRSRSALRLSGSDAHRTERTRSQAGRNPGNLREVPGGRSAGRPDEDLSRSALQHGRALGRLPPESRGRAGAGVAAQSSHEHPRTLRHRRVRLSVPRGESTRRQFVVELHFLRPLRRTRHRKLAQVVQQWIGGRTTRLAVPRCDANTISRFTINC